MPGDIYVVWMAEAVAVAVAAISAYRVRAGAHHKL